MHINRTNPVQDPEAGGPHKLAIGEWFLSQAPQTPHVLTNPPEIIHDVMRVLKGAHALLERVQAPERAHAVADKIGNTFLKFVVDPQYLTDHQHPEAKVTSQKQPLRDVSPTVTSHEEKTISREPWTTLKFRSASKVKPFVHEDGRGDDDRVLDDAAHGIFGVFDGVGSSTDAGKAAEFVRDFVHDSLLTAAKPTSLEQAKKLMQATFVAARTACEDLHVKGSTTANVSFAVEIEGKNYLIVGNAGDSMCYLSDPTTKEATPVTTEQLYEKQPNVIFNCVQGEENEWNDLSDDMVARYTQIDPRLLRDEVVALEIKPGMRFVHVSDGITGDYEDERLTPVVFGNALQLDTPDAALGYLFDKSIKEDDKSGVAFFAEAA